MRKSTKNRVKCFLYYELMSNSILTYFHEKVSLKTVESIFNNFKKLKF